jgi:predicted ATPase/class 3 adenylate cyclase
MTRRTDRHGDRGWRSIVAMAELPDGVVTFLFTDVEGSTRLWEEASDSMMEALRQHDAVIEGAAADYNGVPVRPRGEGDSRFVVFRSASDAVAAAVMQRGLTEIEWETPRPLRVRASVHTGDADLQLGDYYGSAVNRAARLRGIAHGGQTLMSGSTWELVQDTQLPEGVTMRDMGEHRLKDLTRPEQVFQIDVDGLEDRFPPLTSLDEVPNNLPVQLTDFVGRHAELAEAKRLLATTRLLTILAPGGTGKTRLAIQAAADLIADYPDGVFFVSLAEIGSSDDIVQAVAESLGVALTSDTEVQTQLLTHLAKKRQLLVFDNLEHLSGSASIVAEILKAAPDVTVVATSRSKLNLTGETVLALAGLDTEWETAEDASQASGVQLFIEAATRSNPGFILGIDDLDALSRIPRLTGGMPLGILLAAAWVDMLPIGEIATEIAKSLDFLETEMGDIPDRQRSIRAVFDYSWTLLSPEEREVFTALSVFRGSFSRDAAEAVAGASLRDLANLANKSLLSPNPETARYSIHELLRQYAAAELEQDPERHDHVLVTHAAFYSDLMGKAPTLMSGGRQADLLAAVEADMENTRSAWRHLIATGDAERARKFILGLFMVYEFRGWYSASVTLFDEALEVLPEDSDDEALAALRGLASALKGWSLALIGQPDAGLVAADAPTKALARSSDPIDYWIAVQCLALTHAYLGSAEEMAAKLDEAIPQFESMDEQFWFSSLMNWRSFAAVLAGDIDTATAFLDRASNGLGRGDEYWITAWYLWLRAMIATQENRADDAIDLFTRQVALCREVSYVRGTVVSMEGLGEANVAAGKLDAAATAFIDGMASAEQMGMVGDVLSMMRKVAGVRALQGRPMEAVELLATVLAEPASAHMPFTDPQPNREPAAATLSELEDAMDAGEYAAAFERGSARPYDVAAKELLGDRRGV